LKLDNFWKDQEIIYIFVLLCTLSETAVKLQFDSSSK